MVEPLSTAAAVVALVGRALVLSQQVYSKANDILNAPKHIKAISIDLEDFYTILGTLKGYLDDDDLSSGVLHHATSENLESVLKNSINIFKDISRVLALYNARGGSGNISQWRKIKFSFMKDEVEALRNSLAAYKMTLNMAISVANL
jgi:Fungal N-terminal domain of STAND proteins